MFQMDLHIELRKIQPRALVFRQPILLNLEGCVSLNPSSFQWEKVIKLA